MAQCLRPVNLPRPGISERPSGVPFGFWKDNLHKPYFSDTIVVPCGKCINCLKNKQSDMVVRAYREAQKRGSFVFVTLTYDDDHLPISQTLNRVSRETGEIETITPPELCSCGSDPDPIRAGYFRSIKPSAHPRYYDVDIPGFSSFDSKYDYFVRYTPSVCRRDVRLWLKRSRVAYERDRGFKLSEFSYCCVSEYGPRTCRPHYHLAFFGLNRLEVEWLVSQWTYGFTQVKYVSRLNDDGSDGWQKASNYIGKYMSKGKFECESVRCKAAEKPRVCRSMHFGTDNLDAVRAFVCCFDMYGEYDLESLRLIDTMKPLSRDQLDRIVAEIPNRLIFRLNDKVVLPLPRVIREHIFYNKSTYKDVKRKVPSALWYLASAFIRDQFAVKRNQEFAEFLSCRSSRALSEVCAEFAYFEDCSAAVAEVSAEKNFIDFYKKSVF